MGKNLSLITKNGYYKWLMLLWLPINFLPVKAQQPYSLIHYDENILPQTSLGNIQQDENGYVWMNTQYGIVRFDGEKVRVFTTDNLKGLSSNRIRLCAKGWDQQIYFVDEHHTILQVTSPNQITTIAGTDSTKLSLPLYSALSNDDFGYLPFKNENSYRGFVHTSNIDLTEELLKVYVTGRQQGYVFFLNKKKQVCRCYFEGSQYAVRTNNPSFKVAHSFKINQTVFNQTSASEAIQFQHADETKRVPVIGLPAYLSRVFEKEDGVLFSNTSGTFFYAGGELYQYRLQDSVIVATPIFKGLPCTGVIDVMQERASGDYLIGTMSEGFYRIKRKRFSVINLLDTTLKTDDPNSGISNNIIYSLSFWDARHILTGGYVTSVGGTGKPRYLTTIGNNRLNNFFLHNKDSSHIWMSYKDSLVSIDTKTEINRPLHTVAYPINAINLADGTTIVLTGKQIIALQNGRALELYRNDSLTFTTMEKVSENCLIIGSSTGLFYFYRSQKKLQAVPYKKALLVRCLFKDKASRLWFTTYSQGLFHVAGTTITALPMDNAGYLAIGHSILEDHSGNFWITTNHGLFKIAYASLLSGIRGGTNKLYYTYFDKTDGFNTNEFNGGCYPSGLYQPKTGEMFFPSMNGIVSFHPDSIKNVRGNSPVFFDELVLNDTGHVYAVGDKAVFPRQISSIRILFSSPYYGHAANIKYSYLLSNAPGQWNDLGSSRSIVLNSLPGGTYTLTIKKEEGSGTPVLTTLRFEIEKAFAETIWFKLLLLAGVVGLVYLYFKARLLFLNNERKRLEKEVAARTADQRQLIDRLKDTIASLTQLQQELSQMISHKENIIAILIHDIKSPLHFLNTVADHLNKSIATNPAAKTKEIAKEIANSLNRLYLFTQDFAIWLNASESGQLQKTQKIDLPQIINQSLAVYEEIIDKKGLSIRQEIAVGVVYADESMIKSVIRNLVDNAVKNTAVGSIHITATTLAGNNACEIVIADEGRGLAPEQLAQLNDYFQSESELLSFSSSQFGHRVIKDFIRKLNGTIRYRHNSPAGIAITITLPVGEKQV